MQLSICTCQTEDSLNATEYQIYVEVERARVTRLLAQIKEDEGKINEAADILQELQVRLKCGNGLYCFLN